MDTLRCWFFTDAVFSVIVIPFPLSKSTCDGLISMTQTLTPLQGENCGLALQKSLSGNTGIPVYFFLSRLMLAYCIHYVDVNGNAVWFPPKEAPRTVPSKADTADATTASILCQRRQMLGPNTALFFPEQPIHIIKAKGCLLYDEEIETEEPYLDCINNVAHVGHCHPVVVDAISSQLATLNTNIRYLHKSAVQFAAELTSTMPKPLEVVYMLTSGSEANDLALRIACEVAAREMPEDERPLHFAVLDHAYHGHTSACTDLSPYKFNGPGGRGKPPHVHVLPCPDTVRGLHLDGGESARCAIRAALAAGGRLVAFFAESIVSCGGQVILPPGYLQAVYEEMHAIGALCIADEVQCGYGRVGSAFWAFQLQEVVPDIVTLGKPAGNGYPIAALVTSHQVADTFAQGGMEFFATFGGSTAACAAGLAVLKVLREENLQFNARTVGSYCMDELRKLQTLYPEWISDVRGEGLMIGVELVVDQQGKQPNTALAKYVKYMCKASPHRVILSCEGPHRNVIKVKPPLCFSKNNVDRMVRALASVLANWRSETSPLSQQE